MIIRMVITLFLLSSSAFAQFPTSPLPLKAPQPADNQSSFKKIELGKKLYFDPRLSKDGSVSCQSCHNVMSGGTDGMPTSTGIFGQKGPRKAPTVWNAAFHSVQFWDGRAATLEDQAKGPLINPKEMGMPSHDFVVARVKTIPAYVKEFEAAFGKDSVSINNIAKAIAAYERTLIAGDSDFDRYLKGNKNALSKEAIRGMKKVQEIGCTSCHSGVMFEGPALPIGTGFYQKFPTYPGSQYDSKYDLLSDNGRYDVTHQDADKHFFRVQSWRNVALTAPYFHNGKVKTLEDAIKVMAKTQLNKELTDVEVSEIAAFLDSLTSRFPSQTMPRLPATPGKSAALE